MGRSIFNLGFQGDPWAGRPAGIPVYNITRAEMDRSGRSILERLPVPPGITVAYPYIVKLEGVGEYVVNADGTANFYSYQYGRWEPPESRRPLLW